MSIHGQSYIDENSGRFLKLFEKAQSRRDRISHFEQFMHYFGVNFNLYKDGRFVEQGFPFDPIPRILPAHEFDKIERGVKQRLHALNAFLQDVYGEQKIIKDGVIPADFVFSCEAYLPRFHGVAPSKNIRCHISGTDFVRRTSDGEWLILEDNLRVPSGASYPLSIRTMYRKVFPRLFSEFGVKPIQPYIDALKSMCDYVGTGGITVVLTPGRYNSAYYEHAFLAEALGAPLVGAADLKVESDGVYFKHFSGRSVRVGAIYRRVNDDFLDPLEFVSDSLIGVPNLSNAYRSGKVAVINAIGNGIADDKGIYYFVPQMIRYYLGEEPILQNAPTYLPFFEQDRKYVLENLDKLVIKDVAEAGGYGVVFGSKLSKEELETIGAHIVQEPRRFIAQEVVEFDDMPCFLGSQIVPRKADLRVYAVYGEDITVMAGGLTRYSTEEGNYIVNSSQGGGFKDTWVAKE